MPKQFLKLSDFSGGINTKFDARDIRDSEITAVSNMQVHRQGQVFSSTASAAETSRSAGSLTSGYGSFLFKADSDLSNNEKSIELLALADVAEGQVDIIEDPFNTISARDNSNHLNTIDLGTNHAGGEQNYYYANGALRVLDSETGQTGNEAFWYGHIDRTGTIPGGAVNTWVGVVNNLAAPTAGNITESGSANYAVINNGFDLDITIESTDADGLWEATTYELASSFVYEGNQESLLYIYSESVTMGISQYFTNVLLGLVRGTGASNKRIKGGRIYIRKKDSTDLFTLFLDADFERGVRKSMGDEFVAFTNGGSGDNFVNTSGIEIKGPSIDTYESLNGFSHDVGHLSFGESAGLFYKDVTVCNQRAFVCNVNYFVESGSSSKKLMPDRILYTPIGKYDTFPPSQFIDIGINDGEDFTAIESFGTKILAYKQSTLYIIDVTSPSENGWRLESTLNGLGVEQPAAVVKTEFGICWARKTGIYIWSPSSGVVEISKKLDKNSQPMTGLTNPAVGYYPPDSQLIIIQNCSASSDALIYDFETKSFTELGSYTSAAVTNLQNNQDNCIWLEGNNVRKYSSAQGTTVWSMETKDLDFGNPAVVKRPQKLIVSYSTSSGATVTTTIFKDGDGSADALDVSTWATAANSGVKTIDLLGVGNVNSLKFKFTGASSSYKINDITIVYRTIYKQAATGVN
tara:strand:- start:379 stop:2451 length:2073 start_codon:yes stop_codon:yes gene_type:complete